MRKHWKEGIFILPAMIVVLAAVAGFQLNIPVFSPITYPGEETVKAASESAAPDGTKKETKNEDSDQTKIRKINYTGDGSWKDGTYTGSGTGFGGPIEVSVTITDGKIADIQLLSYAGETASYLEMAKAVIPRILAAQSPNVDTVSGATYSSNGIRAAVIQALNKAGGKLSPVAEPVSGTKAPQNTGKKKNTSVPKGKPVDGVYTGSAVCEQFGYTLSLKVRFQNGKATSLSGLKITGNEDEANEAYWKKAWKPMVKRILQAQNTDVDVVSGATYSSNAILAAYENAYAKAVKNKKTDKEKTVKTTPSPQPSSPALPDDTQQPDTAAGTVTDGTYTVSASCEPDARKAFTAYTLTADVTFTGGKCTSMDNFTSTDESNRSYYLKAANGSTRDAGVVSQILEKQSASGINAVSGATCSSKTIRSLYIQALSQATGVVQEEPAEDVPVSTAVSTEKPVQTPEKPTTAVETQTPGPSVSAVLMPSADPEQSEAPEPTSTEESTGTSILDGTYTVSVMVVADEWEDFADYTLAADVTFSGGKLTGIANLVLGDETNQWYCNVAADGYGSQTGIVQQLIARQNGDVDAVSGATCSSLALIRIYETALEMATK